MKTNLISSVSMFALVVIFTAGCEKNPGVQNTDVITAEDELITDAAFDDVFSEVDGIMNLADQFGYELSSLKSAGVVDTCPVISIITEGSFRMTPSPAHQPYNSRAESRVQTSKGERLALAMGKFEVANVSGLSRVDQGVSGYVMPTAG